MVATEHDLRSPWLRLFCGWVLGALGSRLAAEIALLCLHAEKYKGKASSDQRQNPLQRLSQFLLLPELQVKLRARGNLKHRSCAAHVSPEPPPLCPCSAPCRARSIQQEFCGNQSSFHLGGKKKTTQRQQQPPKKSQTTRELHQRSCFFPEAGSGLPRSLSRELRWISQLPFLRIS